MFNEKVHPVADTAYVSDRDRLESAFGVIRQLGIYAEPNFYCCQGCAVTAIVDDQTSCRSRGKPFVYWHAQSDERSFFDSKDVDDGECAEEGDLYDPADHKQLISPLALGHLLPAERDADAVVSVLQLFGFKVDWDRCADHVMWIEPARGF